MGTLQWYWAEAFPFWKDLNSSVLLKTCKNQTLNIRGVPVGRDFVSYSHAVLQGQRRANLSYDPLYGGTRASMLVLLTMTSHF